jgi:hypothetical protein
MFLGHCEILHAAAITTK